MTASKAIIEKEYQPRVIINQKGPNPFNKQFDQELEEYRKEVELKQKGPDGKTCLLDHLLGHVIPTQRRTALFIHH